MARDEGKNIHPHAVHGEPMHNPVSVVEQIPIDFGDEIVTLFVDDRIFQACHG
jgi:hypothetical protein